MNLAQVGFVLLSALTIAGALGAATLKDLTRALLSLVLFFFFETLIGKQLPIAMPYLALGLGLALLGWATLAIREWRMQAQLAMIQEVLDRRR